MILEILVDPRHGSWEVEHLCLCRFIPTLLNSNLQWRRKTVFMQLLYVSAVKTKKIIAFYSQTICIYVFTFLLQFVIVYFSLCRLKIIHMKEMQFVCLFLNWAWSRTIQIELLWNTHKYLEFEQKDPWRAINGKCAQRTLEYYFS